MSDTGDIPYFDMETLSVSYNVSSKDGCVRIPKDLVSNATKKPEVFLRDYIGLPTSILQNEQIKLLKNLHNAILLNDLRIALYNGIFYLVDRNGHKEDIHDLFRPF